DIMPTYYMIRVNAFDDTIKTAMDEWMEFLKNSEIKSDTTVPGLVEAKEVMKFDRMTKEEQDTYIRHLDAVANEKEAILTAEIRGKIEGRTEGRAEGKAEGAQSEKLETARRMKSDGLTLDVIAKYTQLPLAEIERL
ncbi:MAG: hypothetical protein PUC50_10115, partial [Bacteroidales bacterium]|nr:hypothetical protein [Bacteroidales bacterium]